ncbi:MAG: hypothetical protein IJ848_03820 [Alphaproteobacteria bacterium]|nr:hypothetical protein [Alphaproteobacteria bacterium]
MKNFNKILTTIIFIYNANCMEYETPDSENSINSKLKLNTLINENNDILNKSKSSPDLLSSKDIDSKFYNKDHKSIDNVKPKLSIDYNNTNSISSPTLFCDTLSQANTEQSFINTTNNINFVDGNSNTIFQIKLPNFNNFQQFLLKHNLGYQNQDEYTLSQDWFNIWHNYWNNIKSYIENNNNKNCTVEFVESRILQYIMYFFDKFIDQITNYKCDFNKLSNKDQLFNYITNQCINNRQYLNPKSNTSDILLSPNLLINNNNIQEYGFINNYKKPVVSSIIYVMYRTLNSLHSLLYSLYNKPNEVTLQLQSMINNSQNKKLQNDFIKSLTKLQKVMTDNFAKYQQTSNKQQKEYYKHKILKHKHIFTNCNSKLDALNNSSQISIHINLVKERLNKYFKNKEKFDARLSNYFTIYQNNNVTEVLQKLEINSNSEYNSHNINKNINLDNNIVQQKNINQEIQEICGELQRQKEKIPYYSVILKEIIKQIFTPNK